MIEGWEIKKLVDVCIVERGSSPRPIKFFITDSEEGVNWIKIGDTKDVEKYIYSTKQKITKEGAEKSRYVKEGDFILSNSMSFGKPYIMKTNGYIHDGWFVLRLHDFIDTEYFFQLLSSPYVNDQFHKLASGSVVKNISGDLVKKVVLPIPPLPEQKRIVSILDKAFATIDKAKQNAQQNLKNAKELFESKLNSIFSTKNNDWDEKTISEISKIKSGKRVPKGYKLEFENTGFPYIRVSDFNEDGCIDLLNLKYISKDIYNVIKQYIITSNDLYISIAGTIGKTGIIPEELDGANLTENAVRLVFEEKLMNKIVYYFTLSESFQKQAGLNTRTAAMPKLAIKRLATIKISIPNKPKIIEETISYLNKLQAETKKLEAIYQKKIVDLDELKKSVLQKAFNGEL